MPIVAGKEYPYTREGIAAANLAQAGRNEDNALLGGEVAHISAAEADLLKSLGGAGTINPVTGLRQYEVGTASPGPGSMGSFGQSAASSSSPGSAATGSTGAGFGGYLPPGMSNVMGIAGVYSGHPAITQRFPGRTLAEKVSIYSQKKAREAAAFAAPHRRGVLEALAAPAPAAAPVALEDLAGSSALAASSLDPFSFPPNLSTDENVLVPYDAALGTLPVGDQAPTLVPSVLEEPDIFNPQTGFVEPQPTFAQGGAVMPGLGFRPLRSYDDGTGPQGVTAPLAASGTGQRLAGELMSTFDALYSQQAWDQLSEFVRTNEDIFFTRGAPASFLGRRIANMLQNLVDNNMVSLPPTAEEITAETEAFEASRMDPITQAEIDYNQTWPTRQGVYNDAARAETFEQFRSMQPTIGVNEAGWKALRRGETLSEETPEFLGPPAYTEVIPPEEQDLPPYLNPSNEDLRSPKPGFSTTYRSGQPPTTQIDEMETMFTLPGMQAGGYVGRGTMAGELGRRGDLSVRQAGETMFERMKRLRGYANGGYADGYHTPRGTMAGELAPKGSLPVRVAGESMGELHKRHQDQDWYNRMGGGLGSLGRRRGVA